MRFNMCMSSIKTSRKETNLIPREMKDMSKSWMHIAKEVALETALHVWNSKDFLKNTLWMNYRLIANSIALSRRE